MTYRVGFLPEARDDLRRLFAYIAEQSGAEVAQRYVEAIVERCDSLAFFPNRGTPRPDLAPGHRSLNHKGRCLIVYAVEGSRVDVAGIFYGGRDIAAAFDRP